MSRRRCLTICLMALAWPSALVGQGESHWSVAVDTPPGTPPFELIVDAPHLAVSVSGQDADSAHIVVRASGSNLPVPRPVLSRRELRFVDTRNDTPLTLEIRVPRETSVRIRTSNRGLVRVEGVGGLIEVENSNAPIEILGARESVVAATSNAGIRVDFEALPEAGSLSFITSNAPVTLALPADTEARFVLETDGNVESEFDLGPLTADDPAASMGARAVRGSIGAGGPLLRVLTDNDAIRLVRRPGT